MKTLARTLTLIGTIGLMMSAGAVAAAENDNGGFMPQDVVAGSLQDNRGNILCTAAVNSDGTKAGGTTVQSTSRVGVGTYNVVFKAPCTSITAARGWARWVQPDTLQIGTLPAISCTTADLSVNPNGVWINCYDGAGSPADTSLFLFMAR